MEQKLKSKYIRRRSKSFKTIQESIHPKIDHNLKNMTLDNRIQNIMGEFESNKFSKMLSHEREILEKYRK